MWISINERYRFGHCVDEGKLKLLIQTIIISIYRWTCIYFKCSPFPARMKWIFIMNAQRACIEVFQKLPAAPIKNMNARFSAQREQMFRVFWKSCLKFKPIIKLPEKSYKIMIAVLTRPKTQRTAAATSKSCTFYN